jgi:hypothetical protein
MHSDTTRRYERVADFRPGDKWGRKSRPPRVPTVRRGTRIETIHTQKGSCVIGEYASYVCVLEDIHSEAA